MVGLDDAYAPAECHDSYASPARDVRRVAEERTPSNKTKTLANIIEAEIIPRLLVANGEQKAKPRAPAQIDVDSKDIDDFADMMIGLEIDRARTVIAGALAKGVPLDTIMLEVLAPTAHRLGDRWVDDRCTFTDVTVGLCALQSLLRAYEDGGRPEPAFGPADGCALLAAMPGEQHTFGLLMLETFLRRAGWDIVGMPFGSAEEILAAVGRRSFAMIGFSLSRESEMETLTRLISDVRARSKNPGLVVMVGGRVFNEGPERVRSVGADLTAADGRAAVVASQHVLWSTQLTH